MDPEHHEIHHYLPGVHHDSDYSSYQLDVATPHYDYGHVAAETHYQEPLASIAEAHYQEPLTSIAEAPYVHEKPEVLYEQLDLKDHMPQPEVTTSHYE